MPKPSFDYVKYDEMSMTQQAYFKHECEKLSDAIAQHSPSRAQSLAFTKLEEVYMWIGKMIRDDQITRNGSVELQEERKDG